MYLYYK